MRTTEREIVPGDALKSLSQHYLSIPGYMVGMEGGRTERNGKRLRDRGEERRGEERRREALNPSPTNSPLQTELELKL